MAKDPPPKQSNTASNSPFRKFEGLAKKIVRVPKDKAQKPKQ